MIFTTNNVKKFIEEIKGDIYIYGAGEFGHWVGYYMDRCNINFNGFLDIQCDNVVAYETHFLWNPTSKLKEYKRKSVRIIIASKNNNEGILRDILEIERTYGIDCYCLTPFYFQPSFDTKRYEINWMLAYFRRKLFKGDFPSFLSNTCLGGTFYEALGLPYLSPMINIFMFAHDYIKFCENLAYYLSIEMKEMRWERVFWSPSQNCPVGILDDIKIYFGHYQSLEKSQNLWNNGKRHINWQRIVFVLSDHVEAVTQDVLERFCKLSGERLFVNERSFIDVKNRNGTIFMHRNNNDFLVYPNKVLESEFDILSWINQE